MIRITIVDLPMPALETFDWLISELWPKVNDETKQFLKNQRDYLLSIRNENERRLHTRKVMDEIREMSARQRA